MERKQTTYSAILGAVLAGIRKSKGIEQGDMAIRMGVSQASYSRLEGGKSAFNVNQMYQAAEALGISSEELVRQINSSADKLYMGGVEVVEHVRGNATQSKQKNSSDMVGNLVIGAALGGLLIALLSKK